MLCCVFAFAASGCGTATVAGSMTVRQSALQSLASPVAPARFAPASDSATQVPDWAGLLDPQLAALQARALAANTDMARAAVRLLQAKRQAELGSVRLTPQVSAGASVSRPLELQRSAQSFNAVASMGWEWDLWGRLAQQDRAAQAQISIAESDVQAAQLALRSRVAESYWTIASLQAQQPLALRQVQMSEQLLVIQRLRVQECKLAPIEVDRAATSLSQARARLADLHADMQLQRAQLSLLLDTSSEGLALDGARLPAVDVPIWQVGHPAQVLERRPDVARARLSVDAALARLVVSDAERYPRLSFSVGLSSGGPRASDWLSQPLGALAANLVVPLIDWRRLDLQRDLARGELELAALALRDTVARAVHEVESQMLEAQRVAQLRVASSVRTREAQLAERQAALRLEAGSIARAELLQIQLARLESEQSELSLRLRAWLVQAALGRALALP